MQIDRIDHLVLTVASIVLAGLLFTYVWPFSRPALLIIDQHPDHWDVRRDRHPDRMGGLRQMTIHRRATVVLRVLLPFAISLIKFLG